MTTRLFLIALAATTLSVVSGCSQKSSKVVYNSMLDIQDALIQASNDSLKPCSEVKPIYLLFADSLYKRATTPGVDIAKRLDAQKRASLAMTMATMKFSSDTTDMREVVEALNKVTTSWVINATQAEPLLFKEVYVITDDGNDDSIMIDVLFNGEDKRESDGGIVWMPHNTNSDVSIIFANLVDGALDPNFDNADVANIIGVAEEGQMGQGAPMALSIDNKFLPDLKKYDLMFISYKSTTGSSESFIVNLERLHEQMKEVQGIFRD